MSGCGLCADDEPRGGAQKKKSKAKETLKGEPAEFVAHRIALFEKFQAEQKAAATEANVEGKATYTPTGQEFKIVLNLTTPFDLLKELGDKALLGSSIAAKVHGVVVDLKSPFKSDSPFEFLDFESDEGKHVFWHSSAHMLGQAMERLYGAHLTVGPALEDGFYYDSYIGGDSLSGADDTPVIEKEFKKIAGEKQQFERLEISKAQALEMFKFNKYKSYLLEKKVPEDGICSVYRCGPLIDPCRGPHVTSTSVVKQFKVTKLSAAYWLGDAANDHVQRVYGVSFPTGDQMKEWKEIQKAAEGRDHRLIGVQQELFFFHELSPGSAFFMPHGARIYNRLVDFIKSEYRMRGFEEVITPNIYNHELWKTSGHLQHYQEHMFNFEVEKEHFALKPMNCPGHCLLFDHRVRSYRELPMRVADFGVLHRNEFSGALTGLIRVRRFQQDDAHIFCMPSQIVEEVDNALKFMAHVYGIFGFTFELRLSTRPEKYVGSLDLWAMAEKQLEDALNRFGAPWTVNPGDGAFYGPKIDIKLMDALRRKHQCATIQLDFQLPIRFNLSYASGASEGAIEGAAAAASPADGDQNSVARPVIIHRAILGSVERMVAILTEQTGGKWPLWLSPRQAIFVPITEDNFEYCVQARQQVHDAGFYVDCELSSKQFKKKIRESQLAQYNYILVVGAEEMKEGTVNVRTRDNKVHGTMSIAELIEKMKREVNAFE